MKTNPKEVIGFSFQVIPMEEAKSMAIAGNGNYAELKAKILEQIPQLKENESFAFGLPKGEVAEDQRRGIIMAVNSAIKKAKLQYRFTYSSAKRLFVCVPPSTPRNYKEDRIPRAQTNGTFSPSVEKLARVCLKLWGIEEEMFRSRKNWALYPMRKAMQYVGVKNLGLKPDDVGAYFGNKKDAVYFNLTHLKEKDHARIRELNAAI